MSNDRNKSPIHVIHCSPNKVISKSSPNNALCNQVNESGKLTGNGGGAKKRCEKPCNNDNVDHAIVVGSE